MKSERIIQKNHIKSILYATTLLLLIILVGFVFSTNLLFNKCYAEDTESLTTPQILNFNQLFKITSSNDLNDVHIINDYGFSVDNTYSGYFPVSFQTITFNANNKYYLYLNTSVDLRVYFEGGTTQKFNTIYSPSTDISSTRIFNNNVTFNDDFIYYIYVINLTQMFGENIPTVEECEQIFTSEYYNYTTGTPINGNYFSNYLDAYNDIMQSYKYQLSTTALSNYTYSYDYNGDESYFEFRDDGTQTWYFLNTFAVPLFTKINANAQVTINYYFYAPNFTLNYYLNIMAYDSNGNLITIFTETTPIDTGNAQQTTFTLPFDVDVLYFNCRYNNNIITSANFMLYNFELSANQLDLTTLAFNAQESAKQYYERYYGVGGQGYNNIYNAGFSEGSESQKPFTDTWDFIGQSFHGVGEILSMQLIPGLPLGLFVALPLLVGLLFFIVKIAKGSGG